MVCTNTFITLYIYFRGHQAEFFHYKPSQAKPSYGKNIPSQAKPKLHQKKPNQAKPSLLISKKKPSQAKPSRKAKIILQVGPSQYSKLKKNLYIVIKFHNTINFRDSEKVWFWCQGWKVIRYSHDELPDEMPSQNQASALFLNLQAKPSQARNPFFVIQAKPSRLGLAWLGLFLGDSKPAWWPLLKGTTAPSK